MIGVETQEVERKERFLLKILSDSRQPLGTRVIARLLKDHGIHLGKRAVRYHLKLMDKRGLTRLVSRLFSVLASPDAIGTACLTFTTPSLIVELWCRFGSHSLR